MTGKHQRNRYASTRLQMLNGDIRDRLKFTILLPSRAGPARRARARESLAYRGLGLRFGLRSSRACRGGSLSITIHSAGSGDGLGDGLLAADVGRLSLAP